MTLIFIKLGLYFLSVKLIACSSIVGNFTYCDNFNSLVQLDLSFNCGTHDDMFSDILKGKDSNKMNDVLILKKKRDILNTNGTQCFVKKITGYSYYNFFYSRELVTEIIKLNEFECRAMKANKNCYGNQMTCEGDSCFYKPTDLYEEYSFLSTTRKESFECAIVDRLVVSYDENENIFKSRINSCKARDGLCFMHDSTIVWNTNSINTCPYENLYYAYGFIISNNLAISRDEQLLFKLDSTQADCDGVKIRHTTSGLGLVFNPHNPNQTDSVLKIRFNVKHDKNNGIVPVLRHSLKTKAEENKIRLNESKHGNLLQKVKLKTMAASEEQLEIVIAEEDYNKYELNSQFASIFNREEIQMCNLFKNQMDSYRALNNMFFEMNMLDSTTLIVFSKDSILYLPRCFKVNEFEIHEESSFCYEDIPTSILLNGTKIKAFLSKDGFLRPVSRQIPCRMANLNFKIPGLNYRILQKGYAYEITREENVKGISFHPNNINISDINFKHHMEQIPGIDITDTIQDLNKVKEINGDFYILPNHAKKDESAAKEFLNNLKEYKDNYKEQFWTVSIVLVIIIACLLEKVTGIWSFFFSLIKNSTELCGVCCRTGKACCESGDLV